ncbi:hypothetical protein F5Y05DRAFT_380539 [Hypoxylon sp. FL0543]|nr:hypothetical protein F5Y05DRAFT_380539 [Hypoxylon sp. FL0543]
MALGDNIDRGTRLRRHREKVISVEREEARHQAEVRGIKKQIESVRESLFRSKQSVDTLEAENKKLKGQISDLQDNLTLSHIRSERLTVERLELQDKLTKAVTKPTEAPAEQIRKLREELAHHQNRSQRLIQQNRILQRQLAKAESNVPVQTVQPSPQSFEERLKQLKEDLARARTGSKGLTELNRVIKKQQSEPERAQSVDTGSQNYQGMKDDTHTVVKYLNEVAPPHNSITPQEFEYKYVGIESAVKALVHALVEPLYDDEPRRRQVMVNARRSGSAAGVVRWITQNPDIARLARYQDTGEEVMKTIILRWLHAEIWSTNVCGMDPLAEHVLGDLETSIRQNVKPEPYAAEITRWRHLTRRGLLAHPGYRARRKAREGELASALMQLLDFLRPSSTFDILGRALEQIVRPAIRLHEQALNASTAIKIEFPSVSSPDRSTTIQSLLDKADSILCSNVLRAFRRIDLKKESKQAMEMLDPICSVTPSIIFDIHNMTAKYTTVCSKSDIIVAWGNAHDRERGLKRLEPGLFDELLH